MTRVRQPTLEEIVTKYDLRLLLYFGSYGTEHYDPLRSDIAYLAAEDLSFDTLNDFLRDLMLFHGKGDIDLVDLRKAGPLLKYVVATEGRLVYQEREGLFEEYRAYCLRYYYDTQHLRQQAYAAFRRRLEALGHGQS